MPIAPIGASPYIAQPPRSTSQRNSASGAEFGSIMADAMKPADAMAGVQQSGTAAQAVPPILAQGLQTATSQIQGSMESSVPAQFALDFSPLNIVAKLNSLLFAVL
ncbi:MAG: hypothetical protein IJU65_05775 [Desulfovibrio sp.]|nr:hypothetical protein [Desulfovibrio sp.]